MLTTKKPWTFSSTMRMLGCSGHRGSGWKFSTACINWNEKGDLVSGDAKRLIRRLEMEVRLGYWPHQEFSWTDAIRRACQLAEQHGPTLSIRGMDLFHVAIALTLRAPFFLSFDTDQIALAQAVGLDVP